MRDLRLEQAKMLVIGEALFRESFFRAYDSGEMDIPVGILYQMNIPEIRMNHFRIHSMADVYCKGLKRWNN